MAVLTLGAVGSSWFNRVAGLVASRSASFLDNSCFYGHISSSAEALQVVAHGLGLQNVPPALAPLLAGTSGFANEPALELGHDRIFIEIPGRKTYMLDGVYVNPVLLRRFFAASPRLADAVLRHWPTQELRKAYFAGPEQEAEIQEATDDELWILENVSVEFRSDDQVMLDLRRLHALLGNRMVVVAPPNLRNISEGYNDRFIRLLERGARQLNLSFVDSNVSATRAWHNVGSCAELTDPEFQSYFELVLSNEIIADFVDPAKRLLSRTLDLPETKPIKRPRRLGFRRRKSALQSTGPVHAIDPMILAYGAGSAAWVARWADVQIATEVAVTSGHETVEVGRLGFRAAWYLDNVNEALAYFRRQVAQGRPDPTDLLEGAEAAFQVGEVDVALEWMAMAINADPALVEGAFNLTQAYGLEEGGLQMLEIAAAAGEPIADLIDKLAGDSSLKRRIAHDMLERWAGEQVSTKAEGLMVLALRNVDFGSDVERAKNIRDWCECFVSAELARPLARRALLRALNSRLAELDLEQEPELAEQVALELVALDPMNVRAVTFLAKRRDAEGHYREAAMLLDSIGDHYLGSLGLQIRRVRQWLNAGDLVQASDALCKAEAAHPDNPSLARLRGNLILPSRANIRNKEASTICGELQ